MKPHTNGTGAPLATLYVYKYRGKIVRAIVAQWPPDPCCNFDKLLRIPIMANGDRPAWRAFTWNVREPMRRAIERSYWPEKKEPVNE